MDTSPSADAISARRARQDNLLAGPKPLSCTSCRQRKVKCNKIYPCGPCQKSGINCIFPQRVRVSKAKQGGSKARDTELLRRIGRLESIFSRVDQAKGLLQPESHGEQGSLDSLRQRYSGKKKSEGSSPELLTAGVLKENLESFIKSQETGSTYLSQQFWTTLGQEVDGLRGLLERPQDDEDPDDQASTPSVDADNHSPYLLFTAQHDGHGASQPSAAHQAILVQCFIDNVHPWCHVLHSPTLIAHVLNSDELRDPATKHYKHSSIDAISFSVYFAAVTSLNDQDCQKYFGEDRRTLLIGYKNATEAALARADFLNSVEIATLSAFVIYLVCKQLFRLYSVLGNTDASQTAARSGNPSRSVWTLIGLAVRIAQSLNLHRDGSGDHFNPFEAEMRRRLWWHIVLLDMRSCEDRGSEPVIADGSFDTRLPCNADDDDFSIFTTQPLPDKKGWTEMSFFLMAAELSSTMRKLNFIKSSGEQNILSIEKKEQIVKTAITRIETVYTSRIDVNVPNPPLSSILGRALCLRLWSVLQYPFQKMESEVGLKWPAGSALRTAVNMLELFKMAESHPTAKGYGWFFQTWVPWHPVAMALAELCKTPHGPLAERAWPIVEESYHTCSLLVADSSEGMLWKPVKKLYKRATNLRDGRIVLSTSPAATPAQTSNTISSGVIAIDQPPPIVPVSDLRSSFGLLPNGDLTMQDVPGFAGTHNLVAPNQFPLANLGALPNTTDFTNTFNLDWMPPMDFTMNSSEVYGATMNWDDWNNFIFDAETGQDLQSHFYGTITAPNDVGHNYDPSRL